MVPKERDAVLEAITRRLYEKMEQLMPEGISWEECSGIEKEFTRQCALALLQEPALIRAYYGWPQPGHGNI